MPVTTDNEYKRLFFNLFHKERHIYVVMPAYSETSPDPNRLRIFCNGQELQLEDAIKRHRREPHIILRFRFDPREDVNDVCVQYFDFSQNLTLVRERHLTEKGNLALTTLFKGDAALIDPFYEYYVAQGVEHFFLYYNGVADGHLRALFDRPRITLLDWDYRYWNDEDCRWRHHAQPGQMNDALYRFGKDNYQYMVFCDLDEYLHIPGTTLSEYVINEQADLIGFNCTWSSAAWKRTLAELPDTVPVSEPLPYPKRGKNIINTDAFEGVCVHRNVVAENKLRAGQDLTMLHFANWSKPDRKRETASEYHWKRGQLAC